MITISYFQNKKQIRAKIQIEIKRKSLMKMCRENRISRMRAKNPLFHLLDNSNTFFIHSRLKLKGLPSSKSTYI